MFNQHSQSAENTIRKQQQQQDFIPFSVIYFYGL